MLKKFVTFLEKGNTKNFTDGKVLVYIVRLTFVQVEFYALCYE